MIPCPRCTSEPRQEDVRLRGIAAGEGAARAFEVARERATRRAADRHQAVLRPLAADAHQLSVGLEVADFERRRLAHAEAAPVERLEERAVAQVARVVAGDGVEHRRNLGLGKDARQRKPLARRVEEVRRVNVLKDFAVPRVAFTSIGNS